jgi:hypothetical protein
MRACFDVSRKDVSQPPDDSWVLAVATEARPSFGGFATCVFADNVWVILYQIG